MHSAQHSNVSLLSVYKYNQQFSSTKAHFQSHFQSSKASTQGHLDHSDWHFNLRIPSHKDIVHAILSLLIDNGPAKRRHLIGLFYSVPRSVFCCLPWWFVNNLVSFPLFFLFSFSIDWNQKLTLPLDKPLCCRLGFWWNPQEITHRGVELPVCFPSLRTVLTSGEGRAMSCHLLTLKPVIRHSLHFTLWSVSKEVRGFLWTFHVGYKVQAFQSIW